MGVTKGPMARTMRLNTTFRSHSNNSMTQPYRLQDGIALPDEFIRGDESAVLWDHYPFPGALPVTFLFIK